MEQSKGGELAKRLKEVEKNANRIVGYRTKIEEGVGNKLKDLLTNSNPWRGTHERSASHATNPQNRSKTAEYAISSMKISA